MVALRLIGIGQGKLLDRSIERCAFTEITGDLRRVSGSSVRPGQCPSADLDIFDPVLPGHLSYINLHAHVPKLTEVVVAAFIVARPTEKDIARGLQHALPRDDALALVLIPAFARIGSEHG